MNRNKKTPLLMMLVTCAVMATGCGSNSKKEINKLDVKVDIEDSEFNEDAYNQAIEEAKADLKSNKAFIDIVKKEGDRVNLNADRIWVDGNGEDFYVPLAQVHKGCGEDGSIDCLDLFVESREGSICDMELRVGCERDICFERIDSIISAFCKESKSKYKIDENVMLKDIKEVYEDVMDKKVIEAIVTRYKKAGDLIEEDVYAPEETLSKYKEFEDYIIEIYCDIDRLSGELKEMSINIEMMSIK